MSPPVTDDYAKLLSPVLNGLPASRQARSMHFDFSGRCTTFEGTNRLVTLLTYGIKSLSNYITFLRFLTQHFTMSIQEFMIPNLHVPLIHLDLVNDFLKSLESLRSLCIHHSFTTQCLLALGTSHCLQLKDIAVVCPPPVLPDYDELKGFAQDRREAGVPIQRLLVSRDSQTSVDLEEVGPWRKFV